MPGSGNLPLAGVEAIVEGLSAFQGDVRTMNSALDSIKPRATLLQNVFTSAWEAVKDFGREILNVAEYALGKILADSIEWVVGKIQELITATIDAGSEFQTLELRLQRLNFNTLIESGMDLTKAGEEAIKMTKEQLVWLQKLAATTPYDNTDISNVYTLARSYGFFDKQARGLTEDIVNFASGMGLGNVEIQRIIVNFGQMVQQGKVTQREMNDLARGSFVPVNDVLKQMSKNTGIAMEDMDDFRKTAESVPAFMEAFSQVVETRFTGAAEQMAKTFKAASDNAQDVVKSIGGLHVVKPILDAIGARIAAFTSSFTDNPERWDRMVAAAKRLGSALAGIVDKLFGLLPSSESLADSAVAAIEKIATWVETNQGKILGFFTGIGDTIRDKVIPWIQEHLVPIFERIATWATENGPTIQKFFSTLGEIVSQFFKDITSRPGATEGNGDILDSITKFMQFVIDNKDEITKWVEVLWSIFIVWQVIATIWAVVIGLVVTLGSAILGLVALFSGLVAVLSIPVVGAVLIVIGVLGALYAAFQANLFGIRTWISSITGWFEQMGRDTALSLQRLIVAIQGISWSKLGQWIVQGVINGILSSVGSLVGTMVRAALSAYSAAKAALGMRSPSKLFEDIGVGTMEGFAQGIEKAAGLAVGAMQNAVGQVAMPAVSSMAAAQGSGDTINNTRTANLTINTSAPVEPVIQDFNMMESLMGA